MYRDKKAAARRCGLCCRIGLGMWSWWATWLKKMSCRAGM